MSWIYAAQTYSHPLNLCSPSFFGAHFLGIVHQEGCSLTSPITSHMFEKNKCTHTCFRTMTWNMLHFHLAGLSQDL